MKRLAIKTGKKASKTASKPNGSPTPSEELIASGASTPRSEVGDEARATDARTTGLPELTPAELEGALVELLANHIRNNPTAPYELTRYMDAHIAAVKLEDLPEPPRSATPSDPSGALKVPEELNSLPPLPPDVARLLSSEPTQPSSRPASKEQQMMSYKQRTARHDDFQWVAEDLEEMFEGIQYLAMQDSDYEDWADDREERARRAQQQQQQQQEQPQQPQNGKEEEEEEQKKKQKKRRGRRFPTADEVVDHFMDVRRAELAAMRDEAARRRQAAAANGNGTGSLRGQKGGPANGAAKFNGALKANGAAKVNGAAKSNGAAPAANGNGAAAAPRASPQPSPPVTPRTSEKARRALAHPEVLAAVQRILQDPSSSGVDPYRYIHLLDKAAGLLLQQKGEEGARALPRPHASLDEPDGMPTPERLPAAGPAGKGHEEAERRDAEAYERTRKALTALSALHAEEEEPKASAASHGHPELLPLDAFLRRAEAKLDLAHLETFLGRPLEMGDGPRARWRAGTQPPPEPPQAGSDSISFISTLIEHLREAEGPEAEPAVPHSSRASGPAPLPARPANGSPLSIADPLNVDSLHIERLDDAFVPPAAVKAINRSLLPRLEREDFDTGLVAPEKLVAALEEEDAGALRRTPSSGSLRRTPSASPTGSARKKSVSFAPEETKFILRF